jgi:nucleolar protein 56
MFNSCSYRLLFRLASTSTPLFTFESHKTVIVEQPTSKFGEALREQVEERLNFFESGQPPTKNAEALRKVLSDLALEDEIAGSEDEDAAMDVDGQGPALTTLEAEPPSKKDKKKDKKDKKAKGEKKDKKRKSDDMDVDEDDEQEPEVKKVKLSKEEKKALKKAKKEKAKAEAKASEVCDTSVRFSLL